MKTFELRERMHNSKREGPIIFLALYFAIMGFPKIWDKSQCKKVFIYISTSLC